MSSIYKFIPPYSSAGYDGEPYRGRSTVEDFREGTIDFLEGLRMKPHHWPRIQISQSLDNYIPLVAQGKLIFVLFEDIGNPDYEPYTGREIVMDFSAQQILTTIVRMNKASADKMNIGSLPVLFRLLPNARLQKLAENRDRDGFGAIIKQAITRHAAAAATTLPPTTTQEVTTATTGTTTRPWMPTIGVYMQDLEAGLYYSLWVEIGSHRNIRGAAMTAMKEYVHMLAKYFPGSTNVRLFLQKANNWLQRRRGGISGTLWRRKFGRLKTANAYIPSNMRWRSCTGSQPHFRGYPCALWTIFHTLTVAAYDKRLSEQNFDPKTVLTSIRNYVAHFLGCRECAEHFVRMASSIVNVTDADDVIMWLWRAHNRANKRLAGDITEDPRHPKVQFPTIWMCPTCRSGVDLNTQEIIWNESEVLEFLRRFYGEHYIIQNPWAPVVTTVTVAAPTPSASALPPKLRTAPPPVTLQRLPSERGQDRVLALHGPSMRVYNRDPNQVSDDDETDSTTPRWVAPLDQRGLRQPDRTATNPFVPDFPARGRYFGSNANANGGRNRQGHENENHTTTASAPEFPKTVTYLATTTPTTDMLSMSTTIQTPIGSRSTFREQRQSTSTKIPTQDNNQYPHTQTTTRPTYTNNPQTQTKTYTNYPHRRITERPNSGHHLIRQTQYVRYYPQTVPTRRPHYPRAQTPRSNYPNSHAPTHRSNYPQFQPTQRPHYPQAQTQNPYYQPQTPRPRYPQVQPTLLPNNPQFQTQSPYYRPYPQSQTMRPYNPQPQTPRQHNPQPRYYPQHPQQQNTPQPHYPQYYNQRYTQRPPDTNFFNRNDGLISHVYHHNEKPSQSSTAIGRPRNCSLLSTTWSQCSKSCDTGMSTRFSNDNPRCRMELEMRICKLRPCNMAFREHIRPGSCGATFRAVSEAPVKYGSCSSVVSQKWHYCGSCPGMCCRPVVMDTNWMTFTCKNGEMTRNKFMYIRMCRCLPGNC